MKSTTTIKRNKLAFAISLAIASSFVTGCSSDDDDTPVGSLINANGGEAGKSSSGGHGGTLYIYDREYNGTAEIKTEGSASTGFTRPDLSNAINLGSNPLIISEDTTIDDAAPVYSATSNGTVGVTGQEYMGTDSVLRIADSPVDEISGNQIINYTTDSLINDGRLYRSNSLPNELLQALGDDVTADPAAADTLYTRDNQYGSRIYLSDGDTSIADTAYTGLSVNNNATLTLTDNYYCSASVSFDNDIDNKGTITRVSDGCGISLNANNYSGTGQVVNAGSDDNIDGGYININANIGLINHGEINAAGLNQADDNGGNGGSVYLYASAYLLNTGSISTKGGDGLGGGGYGGELGLAGPTYLENTATLNASGGNNTDSATSSGNGGDGGELYLVADNILNNTKSAVLITNGGNGTNGGDGGELALVQNSDLGALLNAAPLSNNGGHGSEDESGGYGGDGGELVLHTEGAQLQSNAHISSTGGDSTHSSGGDGGEAIFFIDYTNDEDGNITVSGNIDVYGGSADPANTGSGGDGGEVILYTDGNNGDNPQTISLVGYSRIDLNGGNGGYGGHGGGYNNDGIEISVGTFTNEVPLNARGGNTTVNEEEEFYPSTAGRGGYADIYAEDSLTNTATINTNSGDGGEFSSRGGSIELYTYQGELNNSASLLANSIDAQDYGSSGGTIELTSDESNVINSGSLSANGSSSSFSGGNGGYAYLHGINISNSNTLSVNGGNATATTPEAEGAETIEAYGGSGGYIELTTQLLSNPSQTGTLRYSAGTGETENGTEGCVRINFITQGDCTNVEGGDGGEFF